MSIFIVSHSHMIREILSSACQQRGLDATEICDTCNKLQTVQPGDVVMLHTGRNVSDVADQISYLRNMWTDLRIMLVAPEIAVDDIRHAFLNQVEAILPESNSTEALIGTLAVISEGYKVVQDNSDETPERPNEIAKSPNSIQMPPYLSGPNPKPAVSSLPTLSPRESAVLEKLRDGGSNKDISNALGICEATVKVHLRTCFQKIGVKNRTQAAVWATEYL